MAELGSPLTYQPHYGPAVHRLCVVVKEPCAGEILGGQELSVSGLELSVEVMRVLGALGGEVWLPVGCQPQCGRAGDPTTPLVPAHTCKTPASGLTPPVNPEARIGIRSSLPATPPRDDAR